MWSEFQILMLMQIECKDSRSRSLDQEREIAS
jgi:hypothetical protein